MKLNSLIENIETLTKGVSYDVSIEHPQKRLTLLKSIDLFSNNLIIRGLTESTATAYTNDIKSFYNFIKINFNNRCYVDSITRSDINHYHTHLHSKRYKSNTIDRKFDSLKVFFRFLDEFEFINESPIKNFQFKRSKESWTLDEDNYPHFLEWDEVDEIVEAAKAELSDRTTRDVAILELLRGTGCRRDTVLELNWSDVNFLRNEITLKHKKTKNKTVVKMNTSLSSALKELYNTTASSSDAVFISQKGNRLAKDAFTKLIRKYAIDSGVQAKKEFTISSKTFRHSFITHLVRNNVPLIKIAQYTGHKDLETLKIYTHLVANDTEDISSLLN